MHIVLITLMVLITLLVVFGICGMAKGNDTLIEVTGVTFMVVLCLLLISPWFVEYADTLGDDDSHNLSSQHVVLFDGDNVDGYCKHVCWCLSECANLAFVQAVGFESKSMNAKHNLLKLKIEIEVVSLSRFFGTIGLGPGDGRMGIPTIEENGVEIDKVVRYQLSEFNEQFASAFLSELYNPYDEKQFKSMENKLKTYLLEHLSKYGLNMVRLVSFEVI
ncbi:hypothetical protein COT97_01595 [Candidatus Falkowbacteria bacterium CG10_big_fil_rev_8_21_14_0_10_39_11]|uniref:Uncharacterized protein n=1 Tax=Candidatus Falkowbacteria bacterium CG10_big_fil_rev_8_21_14_0_10_39_11 TaxID=1974565 RepID=A0A2H0V5P0_9BACT|nr:MAG: hypothetical protein COT97_01595 [Candidatus Falkowbacteria bacterium CG10_big_fil_rev_8_21_14_0_10_39_11]